MYGRAQVILVVTGIGGRPIPHLSQQENASVSIQEGRSFVSVDEENLDVPAFLRRRRVSSG
jgi:hypothetical protein